MNMDYIINDFITGKAIRNIGAEASRQAFEQFLVNQKGYEKTDIKVDEPITVQFKGENYDSSIDLIVFCKEKAVMAITCVAGSIGSYEREILAGARLLYEYQIPFSVSTDGRNAVMLDTYTGETIAKDTDGIPSKDEAITLLQSLEFKTLDENKKEREMMIYRSFNLEKINT